MKLNKWSMSGAIILVWIGYMAVFKLLIIPFVNEIHPILFMILPYVGMVLCLYLTLQLVKVTMIHEGKKK